MRNREATNWLTAVVVRMTPRPPLPTRAKSAPANGCIGPYYSSPSPKKPAYWQRSQSSQHIKGHQFAAVHKPLHCGARSGIDHHCKAALTWKRSYLIRTAYFTVNVLSLSSG